MLTSDEHVWIERTIHTTAISEKPYLPSHMTPMICSCLPDLLFISELLSGVV
jgi:hypothetical protein